MGNFQYKIYKCIRFLGRIKIMSASTSVILLRILLSSILISLVVFHRGVARSIPRKRRTKDEPYTVLVNKLSVFDNGFLWYFSSSADLGIIHLANVYIPARTFHYFVLSAKTAPTTDHLFYFSLLFVIFLAGIMNLALQSRIRDFSIHFLCRKIKTRTSPWILHFLSFILIPMTLGSTSLASAAHQT